MRRARLSLLGLLAGCTASFDPPSFVAGLRVLAVKAEPPEVAPGETTTLTVLDVDTDGRAIAISWFRCLVRPLPGSPVADDCVTGAQPDDLMSVGAGTPLAFTMPAATPGDLGLPDSTGGYFVPLLAHADTGADALTFGYRVRLATGGPRNHNPPLVSVAHDAPHLVGAAAGTPGEPLDESAPLAIAAGQEVTLRAAFADDSAETYDVVIAGAPTRTVTEVLSFAWFATAGSFSEDVTSPDRPDTKLKLDKRVPPSGTTVDLWVVGRDERGGTDFLHRTLVVQ